MLTYANDDYKDDYEVLYAFNSEMFEGRETYTYLIRERHTNRLALLENCAILDMEFLHAKTLTSVRKWYKTTRSTKNG